METLAGKSLSLWALQAKKSCSNWKRTAAAMMAALICFGTILPAQAAEVLTFYHTDAVGSPVLASDQNGNVIWRETYRPYGDKQRKTNPAERAGYIGKPFEEDFGLSYLGARWYDPALGRFMGMDPVDLQDGNEIHSVNRYAYGNNNPHRFADPEGMAAQGIVGGVELSDLTSNQKGDLGVKTRISEINSIDGAKILSRNVTIVTESGVRFQSDLIWKDPFGGYHFEEIKLGPESRFTDPQKMGLREFTEGKWTVAGQRAIEAGLEPGKPLGGLPRNRFVGFELKTYGGSRVEATWERMRQHWGRQQSD